MKKQLICVAVAAAFMAAAPSVLASENVDYLPATNAVEVGGQTDKQTVVVTDASSNIVYINQADSQFAASEIFKLKNEIPEGVYTVKFGGDNVNSDSKTFYIGMTNTSTDIELSEPPKGARKDNGNGTENIGYLASVNGTFRTLVIKKSYKYFGIDLGTTVTGNGTDVGVQINGVPKADTIQGVWLTTRGIELNNQ